jgi:hypothetical protein
MGRPRTTEATITARIVEMVKLCPTSAKEIQAATGAKAHEISYYLRQYLDDGRIINQNVLMQETNRKAKCWCWAESRPRYVEKKHKCLLCGKVPVPGGAMWVCARCKNQDAWQSPMPFAI